MCDSPLLDDDDVHLLVDALHKDEYGGDWRRHLSPDHPDYDPDAGFDENADKMKDESRRAYAGLLGDGSESRLRHEWADYCRECISLETLDYSGVDEGRMPTDRAVPYCKQLRVEITHEELNRKEKRPDCPLGTDEMAFYARRKKEIEEEYREFQFTMFEDRLNEVWPEFKDRILELIRKKSAELA